MKKTIITFAVVAVGVAAWFANSEASAGDPYYRAAVNHNNHHADLGHRAFHRQLGHNEAHRYPMSYNQHGRLHDNLNHSAYHDNAEHSSAHYNNSYMPRYAPSYQHSGYNSSSLYWRPGYGIGYQSPGFSIQFAR